MKRTLAWAVRLGVGSQEDVEGYLSLDEAGRVLRFEATEPGPGGAEEVVAELAIPVRSIRRSRRILGSPVLVVTHEERSGTSETAFYFAKPPRLPNTLGDRQPAALEEPTFPLPRFGARRSRRRERRQAAAYLGFTNRDLKETVRTWKRALDGARQAQADGN